MGLDVSQLETDLQANLEAVYNEMAAVTTPLTEAEAAEKIAEAITDAFNGNITFLASTGRG